MDTAVSGFPLCMQGQTAREEIDENPALAGGKYYAYEAPDGQLTPAPAGYTPFIYRCLPVMGRVI